MKIAYIIEVMHNSGGMERVLSVCANALCQELDVSIVTLYQKVGRPISRWITEFIVMIWGWKVLPTGHY